MTNKSAWRREESYYI